MKLWTLTRVALAGALLGGALSAEADDLTPVTVSTTWYAQAEHGGCTRPRPWGSTSNTAST